MTWPSDAECDALADVLTAMLGMPIKWVQRDRTIRVLELRVTVGPGRPRVVVAFRTDSDRQGESGDVTSWPPPPGDPRVPLVLRSLLEGLAAKLRRAQQTTLGGLSVRGRLWLSAQSVGTSSGPGTAEKRSPYRLPSTAPRGTPLTNDTLLWRCWLGLLRCSDPPTHNFDIIRFLVHREEQKPNRFLYLCRLLAS